MTDSIPTTNLPAPQPEPKALVTDPKPNAQVMRTISPMPIEVDSYEAQEGYIWRLVDHTVTPLVRAVAEFSKGYKFTGDETGNTYVFFNRMVVDPPTARGKGYGSRIMTAAAAFFDEKHLTVVNPMNPYEPEKADLVRAFFAKFGFVVAANSGLSLPDDAKSAPDLLVRVPK